MTRHPAPAARVLGTAVAVLLAGCGAPAEPASTPTPGPAEAYLDAVGGMTTDDALAYAMRVEEAVAACMAEQGFEYVPDTSSYSVIQPEQVDPRPGTREFAEQFGYGYAASPTVTAPTTAPNPNDAIRAAMTPGELAEYERAYWGDYAEADPDATWDPDRAGCYGAAMSAEQARLDDPVEAELEAEIARIDAELAQDDPDVAAAAREWSACMSDAGYPGHASPQDAEQSAQDDWIALNDAIAADPKLGEVGPDGAVAGEAELAGAEAALATADWDCRAEVGYDAVWSAARDRAQQQYVDAHRAELDAWLAAQG